MSAHIAYLAVHGPEVIAAEPLHRVALRLEWAERRERKCRLLSAPAHRSLRASFVRAEYYVVTCHSCVSRVSLAACANICGSACTVSDQTTFHASFRAAIRRHTLRSLRAASTLSTFDAAQRESELSTSVGSKHCFLLPKIPVPPILGP